MQETGVHNVAGARLYYERTGDGEPLVFIHGFTLDTRMWEPQFDAFAATHAVVRYDLRGFGRSALPGSEPYTHQDDLRMLLDGLGIRRATLVGLSKGGGVALNFALTWPERVQALVLVDSVLGGYPWSAAQRALDEVPWTAARLGGIPAAKAAWLAHPIFAPAMRNPAVALQLGQIVEDYSGWHFVNADPDAGMRPPAMARLGDVRCPVLVIAGALDLPDFVGIAEVIAAQAPAAQLVLLDGVGHMANLEDPVRVGAALRQFLAQVRAA